MSTDDAGEHRADKIGQVMASWLDASSTSNVAVLADAGNFTDLKDEVF